MLGITFNYCVRCGIKYSWGLYCVGIFTPEWTSLSYECFYVSKKIFPIFLADIYLCFLSFWIELNFELVNSQLPAIDKNLF